MMNILMVGMGGAVGAVGRYLISLLPGKTVFPVLTLVTNLLGAMLIGFIVGTSSAKGMQERWILFWKTGVCGGFTTFSTFSLEAVGLFEKGRYIYGSVYVAASVCLCVAGVVIGRYAACRIWGK